MLKRPRSFRTFLALWLFVSNALASLTLALLVYRWQSQQDLQAAIDVTQRTAQLFAKESISIYLGRGNLVFVVDALQRLAESPLVLYAYVVNRSGQIVATNPSPGLPSTIPCCFEWEPAASDRKEAQWPLRFTLPKTANSALAENLKAGEQIGLLQLSVLEHSTGEFLGHLYVAIPITRILEKSRTTATIAALLSLVTSLLLVWIVSRFISRKMARPLEAISQLVEQAETGPEANQAFLQGLGQLSDREPIRELGNLTKRLKRLHEVISTQEAEIQASQIAVSRAALAKQVAHDIRSPLSVIEEAIPGLKDIPEDEKETIQNAASRIQGIANELLELWQRTSISTGTSDADNKPQSSPRHTCLITERIKALVAEKQIEYHKYGDVKFELDLSPAAEQARISVDPKEFSRMLSNLMNNGVEALNNHEGSVKVSLQLQGSRALLAVSDTGKGIPPDIIPRILRGTSYNKPGGSGLGLAHARALLDRIGGSLEIRSTPNQGTHIVCSMPIYSDSINTDEIPDLVLIDNDPLIRQSWRKRAKVRGKVVACFSDVGGFLNQAARINPKTPVYIDSELGDGVRGEVEAKLIFDVGFGEIYLVTGLPEANFNLAQYPWISGIRGKKVPWG